MKGGRRNPSRRDGTEVTSLSAIAHLLEHVPHRIRSLRVRTDRPSPRVASLVESAREQGIAVEVSPSREAGDPEPLLALLATFEYKNFAEIRDNLREKSRAVVVVLDHLQDAQNLGALCRSADAFGVDAVVIAQDRSAQVTSGTYSASVGAVETVPVVQVVNLGEALRSLKEDGFWIIGAGRAEGATPPDNMPDFEKKVLVLGKELEGLSAGLEKLCDWQIALPMVGRVESLNVSVAGGILMYEFTRKTRGEEAQ